MKTLRMRFSTNDDSGLAISLPYARDALSDTEVRDAMNIVVGTNIFATSLTGVAGADIVDREVTVLI